MLNRNNEPKIVVHNITWGKLILVSILAIFITYTVVTIKQNISNIDIGEAQKVIDQKAAEIIIPEDAEVKPDIIKSPMSYVAKQLLVCDNLAYGIDMDYSDIKISGYRLLDNITLSCDDYKVTDHSLLTQEEIEDGLGILVIDIILTNKREEPFIIKDGMFSIKLNDTSYSSIKNYNIVLLNMEPLCTASIGKGETMSGSLYFKVPLFELKPGDTPEYVISLDSEKYLNSLEFLFTNDDELYLENITQFKARENQSQGSYTTAELEEEIT